MKLLSPLSSLFLVGGAIFFLLQIFFTASISALAVASAFLSFSTLALILLIFHLLKNEKPENMQRLFAFTVFCLVLLFVSPSIFLVIELSRINQWLTVLTVAFIFLPIIGVAYRRTPKNPVFDRMLGWARYPLEHWGGV